MVIIITGSVGAGKSYTAVRDHIIDGVADGCRVITNLAGVTSDSIAAVFGWGKIRGDLVNTTGAALMKAENWPAVDDAGEITREGGIVSGGDTIVIDECALLFERGKREPPNFIHRYLAMHRHMPDSAVNGLLAGRQRKSGDVIFLAQELGHIPDSIRKLCGRWIWCRNMAYMSKGMSGRMRIEVYGMAPFNERGAGEPLFAQSRGLDPRIFRCYQSHALEGGMAESKTKKGALDQWRTKITMLVMAGAFLVALPWALYQILSFELPDIAGGIITNQKEAKNEIAEPQNVITHQPPPQEQVRRIPVDQIPEAAPVAPAVRPGSCVGKFTFYRGGTKNEITRNYEPPRTGNACQD